MGESHLRQLWQWVEEPMFCLDGDAAGQRAMQRLAELALPLVKPGQGIRFASLPAKDDPDSFIQREGKTAWERLAEQSVTLSEALLKQASEGVRWGIPEEAAATEQKLMQLASRVADAMLQQHYKNFFRNAVWQAMREAGRNKERVADAAAIQHTGTGNSPSRRSLSRSQREQPFAGGLVSPDEVKAALRRATPQMLQCQRELLSLLAHYPELLCDSEIEEECLRWELAEETLDKLRNVLLRLSVSMGESPDREAWQKALCEQGGKTLLECSLPRKDLAPPLQWQLALKRMHLEQLKEEQNYATFLLQDYEDQHLWSERIRAIQEEILKINQEIEMLLGSYY
jgi:DNA primase